MSDLLHRLDHDVASALAAFLQAQRWFGDKAREIEGVRFVAAHAYPLADGELLAAIAEVTFAEGAPVLYALPLIVDGAVSATAIAVSGGHAYHDAPTDPRFPAWLVAQVAAGSDGSGWVWNRSDAAAAAAPAMDASGARLGTAEQSNSSLLFPGVAVAKILRKLQPGVHPEVELTRFLTQKARFANVPKLLASWEGRLPGGEPVALAVVQSFVANTGDGWSHLLSLLADGAAGRGWQAATAFAGLLGQRTAEMHLALASDPWTPAVAPEPVNREDVDGWSRAFALRIAALGNDLAALEIDDERTSILVRSLVAVLPSLESRAIGFQRLIGTAKCRVHGDYHLGQTLVTPDGDVVILDFEGEPMRSIAERRAKLPPLKDVAGMVRSFSYARGTAEKAASGGEPTLVKAELADWERTARSRFLQQYIATARAGKASFLPPTDEDVRVALSAWEADKALYEVDYELNNRPDWLWLPVSGLLKLA